MQEITFDVKLKTKDLFDYTMRHTYLSVSGVFSLLISFGSLVVCLVKFRDFQISTIGVLLFIALLFPVIQPALLYMKCRKQVKKSKDINEKLTYHITDELITVSQEENKAEIHWYEIRKAVYLKKAIYLYMSPVRAFIFPADQCGGKFDELAGLCRQSIEKYKDYEPEDEEHV